MTKKYLTVSALNNYLKRKVDIDSQLQIIYIKGEISNLKRNINSGHLYFTLKDEKSNISAIMYKGFANQLTFDLKNGDHVLIEASVSVYAVTGYNQLIVRTIEPDGIGVFNSKIVLASVSSLKFHKCSNEPPPLARIIVLNFN